MRYVTTGHEIESEAGVCNAATACRDFVCTVASTLLSLAFELGHPGDFISRIFLGNSPLYELCDGKFKNVCVRGGGGGGGGLNDPCPVFRLSSHYTLIVDEWATTDQYTELDGAMDATSSTELLILLLLFSSSFLFFFTSREACHILDKGM